MSSKSQASYSYLQNAPFTSGKVGVLGMSDGGTNAWLAACTLPFDAVACCYADPAVDEVPGTGSNVCRHMIESLLFVASPRCS